MQRISVTVSKFLLQCFKLSPVPLLAKSEIRHSLSSVEFNGAYGTRKKGSFNRIQGTNEIHELSIDLYHSLLRSAFILFSAQSHRLQYRYTNGYLIGKSLRKSFATYAVAKSHFFSPFYLEFDLLGTKKNFNVIEQNGLPASSAETRFFNLLKKSPVYGRW